MISLDASTAYFTALGLGGPSDPVADNQANRVDIELVGRPENGLEAFYVGFNDFGTGSNTDGDWFFRTRLSGENGSPDGEANGFFYVGIDITGDGSLDYLIEHGGSPTQQISILRAGEGSNSPGSITLGETLFTEDVVKFDGSNATTANSYFETVQSIDAGLTGDGTFDPYDLDGGGNKQGDLDRFLTFKVDFQDFVDVVRADAENGIIDDRYELFDETFAMQMLIVTSQNGNNINSDFGGINDNEVDPNTPFHNPGDPNGGSGGLSGGVDVHGNPVPESASFALLLGVFALFRVSRRTYR
ncbi:hypothetical protein [Coraliomargarita sinensis]|uniref:hypothetical protein n=1 Tax=Coraliomargarita sinensis TaxID=2174842 RepID=UPI000D73FC21|nr:hypothetical protein [Coraliomargarita sinensis]